MGPYPSVYVLLSSPYLHIRITFNTFNTFKLLVKKYKFIFLYVNMLKFPDKEKQRKRVVCGCVFSRKMSRTVRLNGRCAAESNSIIEHDKCPECRLVNVHSGCCLCICL